MVEEKRFEHGGTVKIRYHILSHREIAGMTTQRLTEHVAYLNRQLQLWNAPTTNEPDWARNAAAQWRGAINRELRRIDGELKQRADAVGAGEVWYD